MKGPLEVGSGDTRPVRKSNGLDACVFAFHEEKKNQRQREKTAQEEPQEYVLAF